MNVQVHIDCLKQKDTLELLALLEKLLPPLAIFDREVFEIYEEILRWKCRVQLGVSS